MIYQFTLVGNTLIGIGILFGLSLFLNQITFKRLNTFIVYLTMIDMLLVYAEVLPLWSLILLLIITFIMAFIELSNRKEVD